MFAAMLVSMALGYMPWYNFSAVLNFISQEYSFTAADTGLILAAFQAGYVSIVPVVGWLGDRVGEKRLVFLATAGVGAFSCALAIGHWTKTGIVVLRTLTGVAAGAIYVPGLALLCRWFPAERRGMVLGAYTGALVMAYAGGYFVAAPVAAVIGWRAGILWTSVPAFLSAAVILAFVRDATRGKGAGGDRQAEAGAVIPMRVDWLTAPGGGGNLGPVVLTVAYMGHMWEQYAFWGWLGPVMASVAAGWGMARGAAAAWGGRAAALIILLGAPAAWLWGLAADRRGRVWAIVTASCMSVAGEIVFGAALSRAPGVAVCAGAWVGFWVVADSAIYKAALTDMVHPRVTGLYLGIQSAVGYLVTIAAPVAFGKVLEFCNGPVPVDRVRVWGPAFGALGLGALAAPVGALLLTRTAQGKLVHGGSSHRGMRAVRPRA